MTGFPFFLLAAVGLDLLLGDPPGWPHPVRLIGAALTALESLARPLGPALKRAFGVAVTLVLPSAGAGTLYLLQRLPVVGWLVALYFAFAGLALGQLLREARAVAGLLDAGNTAEARRAVSYLVSRDTTNLDSQAIRRTLAETVSENFNDAFVAPLFYLCLGGPALLWFYKIISTMDSMWGYKTERYRALGWAGARADDILAWIPARLSAAALAGAGFCLGLQARAAAANAPADAARMASPNAGWPMAACAWLLDAPMGGPASYFGVAVQKPALGPQGGEWTSERIRMLLRLIRIAGISVALVFQCVQFGMN